MPSQQSAESATSAPPLSDLRVLELGNIVAGPFASSILADLGAEVVKVERPGTGDVIRSSGEEGQAIFAALNRNKRSVALDLKSEDGLESFYSLIEKADVFIENLGRGTPERLGIGYEDLRELNSELVYLSIKGFQTGPYGDRAGMDVVAEAMSGLMSVTGEPGRPPVRVGTSIADMGAALYGVMGVFLALRDRDRTGEGQRVDGTLFESAAHWMSYWITYADLSGHAPEPLGASHPSWGLYDVFETADGWFFVGVTTDRHWPAFCEATGLTDLEDDPRFATAADRRDNQDALYEVVQQEFRSRSRDALLDALNDANVPAAPVNDATDLLDDPGLEAANLLARFTPPGEDATETQTVLAPVIGERFGPSQYRSPPGVGEHTDEVLAEYGDSTEQPPGPQD
ncbi:CaiB/BaiF CoA transferase family protein [Halobaculum roseum]|uniref:CaiB/BaiF CoA transferase family protein n=1 Tax=Halobaculum roseum TaxID=2175149 RepID=A0ABD5MQ81_9EURY|nr:CoA transferase [Halobaculum roseum]QZY01918.1 CoA transferase [Halobaculum roseum]